MLKLLNVTFVEALKILEMMMMFRLLSGKSKPSSLAAISPLENFVMSKLSPICLINLRNITAKDDLAIIVKFESLDLHTSESINLRNIEHQNHKDT